MKSSSIEWISDNDVVERTGDGRRQVGEVDSVNEGGLIELANHAATELLAPRDGHLIGEPIAAFLPELHRALRPEEGPQFRASMQCRGHRGGESFLAEVWFSSYKEGTTPKLAASSPT